MTDEQIIKAMEYCATDDGDDCFQCPYGNIVYTPGNGGCVNRCRKDALDLINRQKAEIKSLRKENRILSHDADTAFQDGLNENRDLFKKEVEPEIRAEAIKEFAARIKERAYEDELAEDGAEVIDVDDIDDLIEGMTEEKKYIDAELPREKTKVSSFESMTSKDKYILENAPVRSSSIGFETYSEPKYKCEKCGGNVRKRLDMVYASNPLKYAYVCEKCGNVDYLNF